jgi:hypothetical protein
MKKSLLALVTALALLCTACNTAWVKTFDSIVAASAPALINILEIVAVANGTPVDSALQAKVNADATALKTLANDFASASASAAPGVCSQVKAQIGVYQTDIVLIESVAQVKDPNTQIKITLLSNLVSGTAQVLLTVIPSCNESAVRGFHAAPPYSLTSFVGHYNNILVAPTGNAAVDGKTKKLVLHEHGKLARSVTFGFLK